MRKRIFCLLLGVLLLLTGCAGDPAQEPSGTESVSESSGSESGVSETEVPETIEKIWLVQGGAAQFVIVCENNDALTAAEALRDGLLSKTGTAFAMRRFAQPNETLKTIYVGVSYNEVMNPEKPKNYGTYGIFMKDGDLYICADAKYDFAQCVSEFLASITGDMVVKNADGDAELFITEDMLFLKEPQPENVGTLLGASYGDYRIVISEQASAVEKYYAQVLMEYIRGRVYVEIPIVTDTTVPDAREIIVGHTTRTGNADFYGSASTPYTYVLQTKEDDLYIGYTDTYCLGDALSTFKRLMDDNCDSVDIVGSSLDGLRVEREQENDVRIITANVLTMAFCSADSVSYREYKARMDLTAQYVNLYDPDFIGWQECDGVMRRELEPCLDEKYAWVEFAEQSRREYLPVMYNAEKWTVEASGFDDVVAETGHCWGYVWVIFSRIDNPGEKYMMMNLHYVPLAFVERSENHAKCRVPLAEALNAAIKEQLAQNPTVPVIVTGDYNCLPGGDVYQAQIDGIEMDSTYHLTENNNAKDSIDNICVTSELVNVIAHRENADANRAFMSDHAYHYADIRLKSASDS